MDLDFLEIGTSNFDTLIQRCGKNERGISVDAIKYYLDCLPEKKNVDKVHIALTADRTADSISVYYIPEDVIASNSLPLWLKGCNTIGKYHMQHTKFGITHLVKIETVQLLNIDEFLLQKNIRKIKFLKIDTEGHDCVILNGLFKYLETKGVEYYPDRILFESNELTPATEVDRTIEYAIRIGYTVVSRGDDDTVLTLKSQHYS